MIYANAFKEGIQYFAWRAFKLFPPLSDKNLNKKGGGNGCFFTVSEFILG